MNNDLFFSSKKQTWETPQDLFNRLNDVFHFDIDLCALQDTAKCTLYYDPYIDSLSKDWCGLTYWMNPPYDRNLQPLFIAKACRDSYLYGSTILCLIPARTDTKLWQDIIFPHAKSICFLKGRLKFGGEKNAAPFPSALVLFGKDITQEQANLFIQLGHTIIN